MIVRNVLAVIGGVAVAAVVVAGASVIVLKRMADAIPEDMLEDAELADAEDLDADLRGTVQGKPGVKRTPLSPSTA
ncbi:hypothetical protein AB0I28_03130 [Phytomonospora sp. NPDC050363]|uniref:hypothetical protein n=1 Tax=Phytomonospora sp. NPDC050363 TaxID=3155642 RepID=UPI0033FFEFF7